MWKFKMSQINTKILCVYTYIYTPTYIYTYTYIYMFKSCPIDSFCSRNQ